MMHPRLSNVQLDQRLRAGPTWIPVGRLATDRSDSDPQLMTYRNFLDSFMYPYIDGVSEEVLAENIRRCAAACI